MLASLAASSANTHAAGLNTDLVGYWTFDGSYADDSAQGNDLNPQGTLGFTSGRIGQALAMDGNPSNYASREPNDDAVYDIGASDFTVQVWVKYNTLSTEQVLIEKLTGSGSAGWTLTKLSNQQFLFGNVPQGDVRTAPQSLVAGVWYHVVARKSGADADIFVNGVNLTDASTLANASLADSTQPLYVGKRNPADGRNFTTNGALDEVAIWKRALSDAEINTLYNGGFGFRLTSISVPEPCSVLLSICAGTALFSRIRSTRREHVRGYCPDVCVNGRGRKGWLLGS